MKEKLKKISLIRNLYFLKEFLNDFNFFKKNYSHSKITKSKIEYNIILEVHKLEKGMASSNPRPFGIDKVKEIIKLINEYKKYTSENSFAYNLAYSSLVSYCKFYEEHNWTDTVEYNIVNDFLNNEKNFDYIEVGAFELYKNDFINEASIDYDKFLSSRRSIRNFSSKPLEEKDIEKAVNIAIKSPSACNRQMCKIYYIKDFDNKNIVTKYAQGVGLFDLTNVNYFIVTFDMSANYFVGERNQGWFNAGLFSMNFVNALHSLGIGSCFIQFGNSFKQEKKIKSKLKINDSERIAVIITAGYYDEVSKIPLSTRKSKDEIYREI